MFGERSFLAQKKTLIDGQLARGTIFGMKDKYLDLVVNARKP